MTFVMITSLVRDRYTNDPHMSIPETCVVGERLRIAMDYFLTILNSRQKVFHRYALPLANWTRLTVRCYTGSAFGS
jgi:hypothetical protein